MKVLIVDADPACANYLRQGLVRNGFGVDVLADGVDALDCALAHDHCLVVLDLDLPGLDGLSLLRTLRETRSTPVVVVTASQSAATKLVCLRAGANDYMRKPIAMPEFLARTGLHIRRARLPEGTGSQFTFADLVVDLSRKRAERCGKRLDLTHREFSMLLVFIERPGTIVSRAELAQRLWNTPLRPASTAIEKAICQLRHKLDSAGAPRLLHTIRGQGYALDQR